MVNKDFQRGCGLKIFQSVRVSTEFTAPHQIIDRLYQNRVFLDRVYFDRVYRLPRLLYPSVTQGSSPTRRLAYIGLKACTKLTNWRFSSVHFVADARLKTETIIHRTTSQDGITALPTRESWMIDRFPLLRDRWKYSSLEASRFLRLANVELSTMIARKTRNLS